MKNSVRSGALVALPVMLGYFPIAMAFGLLAKNTGISIRDTGLFSLLVFAGASQFMALDLISTGVNMASIILATFLLNLRHLMMTASLQSSLGIGLYAMFAALLFPNFKGSKNVVKISIATALIYLALFYLDFLPAGWDIVVGIIGASALAAFFIGNEEVKA